MAAACVEKILGGLGEEGTRELYSCPAAAVAVFRLVSGLSQDVVLRLLFLPGPVPAALLRSWFQPSQTKAADDALQSLRRFCILEETKETVGLSAVFQRSLRRAHLGPGRLVELGRAEVDAKHRKPLTELADYGRKRWEAVLEYLALPSPASSKEVSAEMKEMLVRAGLTRQAHPDRPDVIDITSEGFQFLLMEAHEQLWSYLAAYLGGLGQRAGAVQAARCLAFLCRLGFGSPSEALATDGWDWAGDFVQHLRQLGLVWMRKRKDGWLYATPAVHLLVSAQPSHLVPKADGAGRFLVVESNYRVYAYTSSTLHLAILSTFADLEYRFEGMAVAFLTRESLRRAFGFGISANQILAYLEAHANSAELREAAERWSEGGGLAGVVAQAPTLLPPAVSDQIRLWEMERDRFVFTPVSLYSNFQTEDDYKRLAEFSRGEGCVEWESAEKRLLLLNSKAHDRVKAFWKTVKKD